MWCEKRQKRQKKTNLGVLAVGEEPTVGGLDENLNSFIYKGLDIIGRERGTTLPLRVMDGDEKCVREGKKKKRKKRNEKKEICKRKQEMRAREQTKH